MSSGGDLGRSCGRGRGHCHCLLSSRRCSLRGFDGRYRRVLACLAGTGLVVDGVRGWLGRCLRRLFVSESARRRWVGEAVNSQLAWAFSWGCRPSLFERSRATGLRYLIGCVIVRYRKL
jgi:hypothetical protein